MNQPNQPQAHTQDPSKFFQLDSEMRQRLEIALGMACSPWRMSLLDNTGELFKLNSLAITELLTTRLSDHNNSARLLTFESAHLEINAPRFQVLRERFRHNFSWRIINTQHHGRIQESSVFIDSEVSYLLRKPVRTAFHGYQSYDINDMKAYLDFYDLVWASSEEAPPTSTFGI